MLLGYESECPVRQEYEPRFPREIKLESISKVPIAMFVGSNDELCVPFDSEKTQMKAADQIIHFEIVKDATHGSLLKGQDLKYFKDTVLLLLG